MISSLLMKNVIRRFFVELLVDENEDVDGSGSKRNGMINIVVAFHFLFTSHEEILSYLLPKSFQLLHHHPSTASSRQASKANKQGIVKLVS